VAAPSVAAAIAAYQDEAFLAQSKSKVIEARQMVVEAVRSAGLRYLPSQTSFLYVDVQRDADQFQRQMKQRGILIRGIYKDYEHWSRVSMGHIDHVRRYVEALPQVLEA